MSADLPPEVATKLADATRAAVAMCAASERGDSDGWGALLASTDPAYLAAAFSGIARSLALHVATTEGTTEEDLFRLLLTRLGRAS